MRCEQVITGGILVLTLTFGSASAWAQKTRGEVDAWPRSQPLAVTELPSSSLKSQMQSLDPELKDKALRTLEKLRFTDADVPYLKVDSNGQVYYADVFLEIAELEAEVGAAPPTERIAPSETFLLHSRPGAPNVLFLDFDGATISGTSWNANNGVGTWYATAYDPDGNDVVNTACALPGTLPVVTVNFTNAELADIGEIWHRVAEDFAPFDVDVTTEEPSSYDRYTGTVLFTEDQDHCGQNLPSAGAGGVAYVGVFGDSNYHTSTSPGFVYWDNLGSVQSRHEAASHEFGHNLSLAHDGTPAQNYYAGHGDSTDLTSWAPIMGVGYYKNVTQWSLSDYPNAQLYNSGGPWYQATADDLLYISSYLGYRPDDHGDDLGSASLLTVQFDGSVNVTHPEDDPHAMDTTNEGVIEDRNDVDYWQFDSGTGPITLTVTPAWAAYPRVTTRGANLDARMRLYDSAGTLLDTDEPTDNTNATISYNITASGRYYIAVDGVGKADDTGSGGSNNGYTDYGSLGMYFISGNVQPGDDNPPLPDPMSWAVEPYALDGNQISMTATTATDEAPVEYKFFCTSGGINCTDSDWQLSTTYVASGLAPLTQYGWRVQARDFFGNIGGQSAERFATTLTDMTPPTLDDATAASGTQVLVSFSEPLNQSSAETVANYSISGATVSTATLQANTAQVLLTTSAMTGGINYILTVNNVSDTTGNPVSNDSQASFVVPYETTISFQQGVLPTPAYSGMIDTSLWQANTGANFGSSTTIYADGDQSGGDLVALVEWDISQLPTQSVVTAVSMDLWVDDHSNSTYPCYELLQDWTESQATWAQRQSGASWDSNGASGAGDRGSDILCNVNAPSPTSPINVSFLSAGVAAVQGWVNDPTSNHGLIMANTTPPDGAWFNSSEFGTSSQRPKLNVTYLTDVPAGTPPDAPTVLNATSASETQIDLSWTDNASDETGFRIERSPAGAGTWVQVGTNASDDTTFSDTGLSSGTYYDYRVYAYGAGGASGYSNVATARTDGSCTAGPITPPTSTWTMFALPCMPVDNTPGGIIPLPDEDYGVTWVIYYFDNDAPTGTDRGYGLLGVDAPMVEGMGYFFYSDVAVPPITITGDPHAGSNVPLAGHATDGRYNLVGNPFNGDLNWADTQVIDGGSTLSLDQVDPNDGATKLACDPVINPATCIMSRRMHKWNGSNYDVFNGLPPTDGTLNAFDVVWIQSFKPGLELEYGSPAPGAAARDSHLDGVDKGPSKTRTNTASESVETESWFVQLIAQSGEFADTTNYAGRLNDSRNGQDYRDLEEPVPFGGKYLSLTFLNNYFEEVDWGFTTDFRKDPSTVRGKWNFIVRASSDFPTVDLLWDAEHMPFRKVIIKDLDSGARYRLQAGETLQVDMAGGERRFKLIVK